MKYKRATYQYRDVGIRQKDWKEIYNHKQVKDGLRTQAARCMDCGVPFCQSHDGCPLSNIIPRWNDLVFKVGHVTVWAPVPWTVGCPSCQSHDGCPLSNIIPRWNDLVFKVGHVIVWGTRAMDCGVPFCQSHNGCPLSNIIPQLE